MKKVECIVREERVEKILSALLDFDVWGVTISSVKGCGRQRGYTSPKYMDKKTPVRTLPFIKLEFVVKDSVVEPLIKKVIQATRTGEMGDGKIFIHSIEDAVRISTGERGDKAILL
jgi:nitrogen regulatory protein P-II 1